VVRQYEADAALAQGIEQFYGLAAGQTEDGVNARGA
jgi:hypothetical protein